jgi:hypothetical protein
MKESQFDRLLKWMQSGKRINQIDAYQKVGIMRLSGRIYELKKAGHKIIDRRITVINRFGEPVTLKEYYIRTTNETIQNKPG